MTDVWFNSNTDVTTVLVCSI